MLPKYRGCLTYWKAPVDTTPDGRCSWHKDAKLKYNPPMADFVAILFGLSGLVKYFAR